MLPHMPLFFRYFYLVMAGLYALLAIAGLMATTLALQDGDFAAFAAFAALCGLSAAISGSALDGLKETYSR